MSIYKSYLYIEFELASPLSIGANKSQETDKDILTNAKGEPYIPASSLAGVYSGFFSKEKKNRQESEMERYFGFVEISRGDEKTTAKESPLIIYDAELVADTSFTTGIRNGVGLDQFRTAKDGAKFDFEVVHPGAVFRTAIEYTAETDDLTPISRIASAWQQEQIIVGGKSTRGMGRLRPLELRTKTFVLPNDRSAWLDFDIFGNHKDKNDSALYMPLWKEHPAENTHGKNTQIALTLNQKGTSPLSVRVYSTEVSAGSQTAADYSHLTYQKDGKTIAVIPGTSWAGTFRHAMIGLLGGKYSETETELQELFGKVTGKEVSRSKILFSETYFENGTEKTVTRNAIDRFTGGAADTALFTEKIYYGGKDGALQITLPADTNPRFFRALAAAIADLHEGILCVGGESSIGHGLLEITKIEMTGKDALHCNLSGEKIFRYLTQGKENG